MTPDVAAEWRRLLAEATDGEWEALHPTGGKVCVSIPGQKWCVEFDRWADAALIVYARNHAAELLDELDRLRGVLDDTHEAMWDLRCITVQSVDAEARRPYLLEALDDADAAHNAYEALR